MADRMLFVTWDESARGMEERALECFNDALGILGRKQSEGAIESFDVALFEPNGSMGGYICARGSREQIMALRADDDFRRNTIAASICVDGLSHIEGSCNEGIAADMALYQEALTAVPQRA